METEREKIVPYLRQQKEISLLPTSGEILSLSDFVRRYLHVLSPLEQSIIEGEQENLRHIFLPDFLQQPLIASNDPGKGIRAQAIGSRSAYLPEQQLKFKGFRPIQNLSFPHERLDFGSKQMILERIRFGSLSAENVMREILAFCFFKKYSLPILHIPVGVFQYNSKSDISYCLIFQTPSERRLEADEDFSGLAVRDLIFIRTIEKKCNIHVLPYEVSFRGVDMMWYAKEKSKRIATMNMHGGFRGVLNSNIGNDLVYDNQFYICDFDTFKVIEITKKPADDFILSFLLWSIAEIVKTSPFVLDYVDTEGLTRKEAAHVLWNIYSRKSSLWQQYWPSLVGMMRDTWRTSGKGEYLEEVIQSEVMYDLLLDNILNLEVLKTTFQPEMSLYVPHNYA